MSLVGAGCGDVAGPAPAGPAGSTTTAPATGIPAPPATGDPGPTAPGTSATTAADPLRGFGRAEVRVGGEAWTVAVADTPALRAQGLMGVTGLGGLDGMLFVWEDDTESGFWMKDTLIPLDIAFFDAGGGLVDLLSMVPCEEEPCPRYRPSGAYRTALEVPAGGFDGLSEIGLER